MYEMHIPPYEAMVCICATGCSMSGSHGWLCVPGRADMSSWVHTSIDIMYGQIVRHVDPHAPHAPHGLAVSCSCWTGGSYGLHLVYAMALVLDVHTARRAGGVHLWHILGMVVISLVLQDIRPLEMSSGPVMETSRPWILGIPSGPRGTQDGST